MNVLEPITLLAAIAGATNHIGLGATASTSFFSPTTSPASLPRWTTSPHGRAAWNVVTSANDYAARNFGLERLPPTAIATQRRANFFSVVDALWTPGKTARVYDRKTSLKLPSREAACARSQGQYFTVQGAQHRKEPARQAGNHPGRASDTAR